MASGYFNPIHIGHIRYLKAAKKLGDELVVIVNNDNQVKVKCSDPFMNDKERMEIVANLKCVDRVVLSIDKDKSVRKTLKMIKPDIFATGADRTIFNIPERETCKKLGIKMVFGLGGKKIQSSSKLLKNYARYLHSNANH